MIRPPHWLDRHGHGEQAWPAGWVVDRYTVQLPVVGAVSDAPSPVCEAQAAVAGNSETESARSESGAAQHEPDSAGPTP